jgi:hypothetical protein
MDQVQQRVLAAGATLLFAAAAAGAQKFYPDDPLWREPKPMPAVKLENRGIDPMYDFLRNTFAEPGREERQQHEPSPSEAVNTLGEVPDSDWFTNRMGSRPMTIAELVKGPGTEGAPATDKPWTVTSGKNEGVTPGLVIRDSAGRRYFLKFDPGTNPEMASAADILGSKFFYALGYNVPENYIVYFDRKQLAVGPKAKYKSPDGNERAMTERDLDIVMSRVPRNLDGRYRALASLSIPGEIIGPFRYHSTRKDDPNDIVDHERRRDLRGLFVFAAWLNHTDTKSINSLDSVVKGADGTSFVRHYLIDFGAILGSDSFEAKDPRAGHVYFVDLKDAGWQALSLGFYLPAWMRVHYRKIPSVGNLDYQTFDPPHWRNNYPNPAFDLRTPGDTYWAAKKVMAFSDEAIRAIVKTAQYSDPLAADWVVECLIQRRDRIGRAFLDEVLPLDDFAVNGGKLVFEDLAVRYRIRQPKEYMVRWFEFDNVTGQKTPMTHAAGFNVPASAAAYLAAEIRSDDAGRTVTVFLRGNTVAGIDRTW